MEGVGVQENLIPSFLSCIFTILILPKSAHFDIKIFAKLDFRPISIFVVSTTNCNCHSHLLKFCCATIGYLWCGVSSSFFQQNHARNGNLLNTLPLAHVDLRLRLSLLSQSISSLVFLLSCYRQLSPALLPFLVSLIFLCDT